MRKSSNIILSLFAGCLALMNLNMYGQDLHVDLLDHVHEGVSLIADRDLYISGEKLYFTAFYQLNGEWNKNELSKVLYVEIYNTDKKAIAGGKYFIQGGITSGILNIPEESPSGPYFLRAYTRYQRNFPVETYYNSKIYIINPEVPFIKSDEAEIPADTNEAVGAADNDSHFTEGSEIKLTGLKQEYAAREEVEFSVTGPDDLAVLTVSVHKNGTVLLQDDYINEPEDPTSPKPLNYKLTYFPEIRDVGISGVVRDKNTEQPISGAEVLVSVLFDDPQMHFNKTRSDGRFNLPLDNITGKNDLFLFARGPDGVDVEIFVNKDFSGDFPADLDDTFPIDSSYSKLIQEMYVNYQVIHTFYNGQERLAAKQGHRPLIFGEDQISVRLADYIALSSLEEVISEIVPYLFVRKDKDRYHLQVMDEVYETMYKSPLVLLDDVPVFNINKLLAIHPSQIEKIDVVNATYLYGDHALEGIVSFTTKGGNFAGYEFPEHSVFFEYQALAANYPFPDYSYDDQSSSILPDFRNVLCWEPGLELKSGNAVVSFYTSDHCSEYDVVVRGFTKTGKLVYTKQSIRVVR